MQKPLYCFRTKSKILKLKLLNNNLIYYDTAFDGIKIFSSINLKIYKNIQSEKFNSTSNIICINLDATLLAYADEDKINIIDITTNTSLNTIYIDSKVTSLSFDSSSNYLFVGSSNGELLQYKHNKDLKLTTLHEFFKSKYNFTDIIFSKNDKVIAGDEYGGIFIADIYTYKSQELNLKTKFKATSVCFIEDDNILVGDAKGYISFISFQKYNITKTITTPFEQISKITTTPNKEYALVSGNNDNYITLLNLKIKKIVILKYLTFQENINDIIISNDGILFIAFENTIISIDIYDTEKLKNLIETNNMQDAYNLIKINPLLKDTEEYTLLEEMYKERYKEAALGLIHKDKTAIIKLQSIYRNIDSKQEDIEKLSKAFKEYKHLQALFLERKYALCYALIDKFPPLKITIEYKKLEEKYKLSLLAAQHKIFLNKEDIAYEILKDYITINSKRATVKSILSNKNDFSIHHDENEINSELSADTLIFHQAYNHNDFKRCYELLDNNPSLNDLEISQLLRKHYQQKIIKCDEFALNGDIQNVQQELGELIKVSTRKQKIGILLKVSFQAKIKKLMQKKLIKEAENMIYSYIDIFGINYEIEILMREFEQLTSITLAISENDKIPKNEDSWYYEEYFKS